MSLNGFVLTVFIFLALTIYITSSDEEKVVIHASVEKIGEVFHSQFRVLIDKYIGPPSYKFKNDEIDAFDGSEVVEGEWEKE